MEQLYPSVSDIKLALANRGVVLRQPAQEESITRLREFFPELSESFFQIFVQFDGFESGQIDGASAITIWEIDRIISVANSSDIDRNEYIAFGDFMMDSEYICCLPASLDEPVFLDESREPLADSYFDFWKKLCSGELDFH